MLCTLEGAITKFQGFEETLFFDIELRNIKENQFYINLFAFIFPKLYVCKQSFFKTSKFRNCPFFLFCWIQKVASVKQICFHSFIKKKSVDINGWFLRRLYKSPFLWWYVLIVSMIVRSYNDLIWMLRSTCIRVVRPVFCYVELVETGQSNMHLTHYFWPDQRPARE